MAVHLAAIPVRSIAAGELKRSGTALRRGATADSVRRTEGTWLAGDGSVPCGCPSCLGSGGALLAACGDGSDGGSAPPPRRSAQPFEPGASLVTVVADELVARPDGSVVEAADQIFIHTTEEITRHHAGWAACDRRAH